jgi:NADP-dependent 3-hydroxy acid dehydrogenase YdfG
MKPIAVITGASSGIGAACARLYAAQGMNLILTGRRMELLQQLKSELESAYANQVLIACFDVQDEQAVFQAFEAIPAPWRSIDILVNNAGLALGRETFDQADLEDWKTMLHTNVEGLLFVSRAVLPWMIERRKGHIVNIGSIAGRQLYERGNVYCASKAAVEAITKSMRIDLLPHGIKVTGIHPGAVETEFSLVRFKGDAQKASATYQGFQPLSAEDVARTIVFCTSQPAHVCINDLELTPLQQANAYYYFKQ